MSVRLVIIQIGAATIITQTLAADPPTPASTGRSTWPGTEYLITLMLNRCMSGGGHGTPSTWIF